MPDLLHVMELNMTATSAAGMTSTTLAPQSPTPLLTLRESRLLGRLPSPLSLPRGGLARGVPAPKVNKPACPCPDSLSCGDYVGLAMCSEMNLAMALHVLFTRLNLRSLSTHIDL